LLTNCAKQFIYILPFPKRFYIPLKTAGAKDYTTHIAETQAGKGFQHLLYNSGNSCRPPILAKMLVPCGLQRFFKK
jgi:hypothetical protein